MPTTDKKHLTLTVATAVSVVASIIGMTYWLTNQMADIKYSIEKIQIGIQYQNEKVNVGFTHVENVTDAQETRLVALEKKVFWKNE